VALATLFNRHDESALDGGASGEFDATARKDPKFAAKPAWSDTAVSAVVLI
jgi:hypothetical protein